MLRPAYPAAAPSSSPARSARRDEGFPSADDPAHILVTGVSPFEDLPGYHYAALLRGRPAYRLMLADDSVPAIAILRARGASIEELAHPGRDEARFLVQANALVAAAEYAAVIAGTDAHLFALARAAEAIPWIPRLCPAAAWIAREGLHTKWELQGWIAAFLPVPRRWRGDGETIAAWFATHGAPPVMVKGLRKGALRCECADELTAAARFLLRNPANQDASGGIYLEEHVDGEEHCAIVVRLLDSVAWIGLRKLATTQTGTTLAAVVEYDQLEARLVEEIAARLEPGMALEIEWRGSGATRRVFEVNLRFPTWVSALGASGQALLAATIEAQLGRHADLLPLPEPGTLIYRLPQSGLLAPEQTFELQRREGPPLLWPSASPHQFLVK